MNFLNEYKGIFYKDNKERKLYEGGAHFKYKELYKKLLILKKENEKEIYPLISDNHIIKNLKNRSDENSQSIKNNIRIKKVLSSIKNENLSIEKKNIEKKKNMSQIDINPNIYLNNSNFNYYKLGSLKLRNNSNLFLKERNSSIGNKNQYNLITNKHLLYNSLNNDIKNFPKKMNLKFKKSNFNLYDYSFNLNDFGNKSNSIIKNEMLYLKKNSSLKDLKSRNQIFKGNVINDLPKYILKKTYIDEDKKCRNIKFNGLKKSNSVFFVKNNILNEKIPKLISNQNLFINN